MYQPTHFVQADAEALAALMHAQPLATVVHLDAGGELVADLLPLLWQPDASGLGGRLQGHVARANPLWQQAQDQTVLAVFRGPQCYVSPGWYPSKAESGKVVPTWNYATVQARGTLRAITDADWLHQLLATLTTRHEGSQRAPWRMADAPDDYIAAMQRAVVGIEITVTELSGKWKVSQNRSAADRAGVVSALQQDGSDSAQAMAALVTNSAAQG
jgi:transcriptional regulator